MSEGPIPVPPAGAASLSLPPIKRCRLCGLELQGVSAHLNKDHCLRDLQQRVIFLRAITLKQAQEIDEMGNAIVATHRFAYAILHHLTEGGNRIVLQRPDFEQLPGGCAVTMEENEAGEYVIVGVVPAKKAEVKPS